MHGSTIGTILGILALLAPDLSAHPPAVPAQLRPLLEALGSESFSHREQATQILEKMGPDILPYLLPLQGSQDPEARRRAEDLIGHLRQQQENAAVLDVEPVSLSLRDISLDEALEVVKDQLDLDLRPQDASFDLLVQPITLETGPVTRWEALRLFCEQAGLKEVVVKEEKEGMEPGAIYLRPGKAGYVPMSVAGRLRIRALQTGAAWPRFPGTDLTRDLLLEARSDSATKLLEVVGIRIEEARDENGSPVLVGSALEQTSRSSTYDALQELVKSMDTVPAGIPLRIPLSARQHGSAPSRRLSSLKGHLVLRVETPPVPLATIHALPRSIDQVVSCADGRKIKVTDLRSEPDGIWIVCVTVTGYLPPGQAGNVRIPLGLPPGPSWYELLSRKDGGSPIVLVDERGSPLHFATGKVATAGEGDVKVYTLTFLARKDQGRPVGLIYRGSKRATLDVPFVLKDVPLD